MSDNTTITDTLAEALRDISRHSVKPFTGPKWHVYAKDVADGALAAYDEWKAQGGDDKTEAFPPIYAKADHPLTCLNPDRYFKVTRLSASGGKLFVGGDRTCGFSAAMCEFFSEKGALQLIEEEQILEAERSENTTPGAGV